MAVDSFLELYGTLYGWLIYGIVWDVMLNTGVAFIPFVLIFIDIFVSSRSQSDGDELAVGLIRQYEVKFGVAALVILLCVHPVVTINAAEVVFIPNFIEGMPGDKGSNASETDESPVTYGSIAFKERPGSVQAPLLWALFMNVTSALNRAIIEGLPAQEDLRYVSTALTEVSIKDKHKKKEFQGFYRDCYLTAKAKYEYDQPDSENVKDRVKNYGFEDPFWPGSRVYLTEPGYYNELRSMELVKGFAYDDKRDLDIWQAGEDEEALKPAYGKPTCQQWWEGIPGENEGLKNRLVSDESTAVLVEQMKALNFFTARDDAEDRVIKSMLENDPPGLDSRAVDFSYGNTVSNHHLLASAENLLKNVVAGTTQIQQAIDGSIRVKNILDAAPIVQSILILIILAMMPIVFISAKYDYSVIGTAFSFYFIIKFWTVLWYIAWFVDQNLVTALYPDLGSWFSGATIFSPSKRILLNMITTSMYVGFPLAFIYLMSGIGNTASSMISKAGIIPNQNINAVGAAKFARSTGAQGARNVNQLGGAVKSSAGVAKSVYKGFKSGGGS